jgi:hypothetical protein
MTTEKSLIDFALRGWKAAGPHHQPFDRLLSSRPNTFAKSRLSGDAFRAQRRPRTGRGFTRRWGQMKRSEGAKTS